MSLRVVVLPEPLRPSRTRVSPRWISRVEIAKQGIVAPVRVLMAIGQTLRNSMAGRSWENCSCCSSISCSDAGCEGETPHDSQRAPKRYAKQRYETSYAFSGKPVMRMPEWPLRRMLRPISSAVICSRMRAFSSLPPSMAARREFLQPRFSPSSVAAGSSLHTITSQSTTARCSKHPLKYCETRRRRVLLSGRVRLFPARPTLARHRVCG